MIWEGFGIKLRNSALRIIMKKRQALIDIKDIIVPMRRCFAYRVLISALPFIDYIYEKLSVKVMLWYLATPKRLRLPLPTYHNEVLRVALFCYLATYLNTCNSAISIRCLRKYSTVG